MAANELHLKRTELVVEIVRELEQEGQFPTAHYAFDNGVLTLSLPKKIQVSAKRLTIV